MLKCYNHEEKEAVGICTNCGKAICDSCEMEVHGKLICKVCAEKKLEAGLSNQNLQEIQRVEQMQLQPIDLNKKNKDVAAMLAIFGGWFGLHKFYLNKPGQGIAMAVFSTTGIPLLISLVEAYSYFTADKESFDRKYNPDLFGYREKLEQPMPLQNPEVTPHKAPNKHRNTQIIDLQNDLVDEKKEEEKENQKQEEQKTEEQDKKEE